MATQVQFRGGTTTEHASFNGAAREVTVDTTKQTLVVQDGTTNGGYPLMRENGSQGLTTTGQIFIDSDSSKLKLGDGEELQIYHSSDNNSYITESGSGSLVIKADDFYIQNAAGSHSNILIDSDGRVEISFDGTPKLATRTYGLSTNITNALRWIEDANSSSRSWQFIGEDGAYGQFELLCNDSDGGAIDKTAIKALSGGTVELYHSGSKKIGTLTGGVQVTGSLGVGTNDLAGEPGIYLGDGTNPAGHIYANGTHHLYILANAYYGGAWKYQGAGEAGSLTVSDGALTFNTADANTGSAGASVTWKEVFQAKANGDVDIHDGNLVVADGHGINFSASGGPQGAALGSGENELLDDYEHGFFTPTISGSTTAGDNISYVSQVGTYIKVGTLVNVSLVLMVNNIDNAAGDLKIHGFPFVHKAGTDSTATVQYNSIGSGLPAGREGPAMAILQGGYSTVLQVRVNDSGTSAYSPLAVQTLSYMRLSLTYFA